MKFSRYSFETILMAQSLHCDVPCRSRKKFTLGRFAPLSSSLIFADSSWRARALWAAVGEAQAP